MGGETPSSRGRSWDGAVRAFPGSCPLNGDHLTLDMESARPRDAAGYHLRERGTPEISLSDLRITELFAKSKEQSCFPKASQFSAENSFSF